MQNDTEPFLTAREAAVRLRVGHKTVLRWLSEGQVCGARLPGGAWRIPESEVDRLLAVSREAS